MLPSKHNHFILTCLLKSIFNFVGGIYLSAKEAAKRADTMIYPYRSNT